MRYHDIITSSCNTAKFGEWGSHLLAMKIGKTLENLCLVSMCHCVMFSKFKGQNWKFNWKIMPFWGGTPSQGRQCPKVNGF